MSCPVLNDFKLFRECDAEIIDKYSNALPEELLEIWKEYGFGSFGDGYFKIINPDEYQEIFDASYFDPKDGIPFMATALGDLFVWKANAYIYLIKYRYGSFSVVGKRIKRLLGDLSDQYFADKCLENTVYDEARESNGEPAYDECFGYFPILALGGSESAAHLKNVKTREHILLITQLAGKVGE